MQTKYINFEFYRLQFLLKFVGIVSVSLLFDSVVSLYIIAKSSIILAKSCQFSQIHVPGLQI